MKRVLGILVVLALLTGVGLTAQSLTTRTASNAPSMGVNVIAQWIATNGPTLPEPVSIMLLSFVLFTGTTLVRRYRTNRRA